MKQLIILYGAAGAGKTTVAKLLKDKLNAPAVHYDWLRRFHLDRDWSQTSYEEADMAFRNVVFIIKNYYEHDYSTVIVDFLYRDQQQELSQIFKDVDIKIFTLLVDDKEELKRRVLSERDSGWTLHEDSVQINKEISEQPALSNEIKIETSGISAEAVAAQIAGKLDR